MDNVHLQLRVRLFGHYGYALMCRESCSFDQAQVWLEHDLKTPIPGMVMVKRRCDEGPWVLARVANLSEAREVLLALGQLNLDLSDLETEVTFSSWLPDTESSWTSWLAVLRSVLYLG